MLSYVEKSFRWLVCFIRRKLEGSNPSFTLKSLLMSRISQLTKNARFAKIVKPGSPKLRSNPQKKAVCLKVLTTSPKKPNSANRPVSKAVVAQYTSRLTVKIVGEGHNLQQHSTFLIRGGRVRDLIGVRYIAVRGVYDFLCVKGRKSSRSLYGVKRF
jgi:small subunit ribosomal protein S12